MCKRGQILLQMAINAVAPAVLVMRRWAGVDSDTHAALGRAHVNPSPIHLCSWKVGKDRRQRPPQNRQHNGEPEEGKLKGEAGHAERQQEGCGLVCHFSND
jgi:hypothetical protein